MAISAALREDIIQLAVVTNNAAPGTTLLAELVALADAGKTLTQIADTLVARSAFTATYPTHQTSTEFGTEWIATLLPEASAALQAECVIIVEGHINGGGSIASLMVDVQAFMAAASTTDVTLGTHISNFNNKVTVATYHTITEEGAAEWTIPSTVTSVATTVATGKAAVDTALAPAAAAVATFALASDVSTVSEGGDVVYTLTTTNVTAGTEYSYVISGINSADLSSGSLTGLAEVDSDGKATVSVGLKNDTTTEGAETMVMTVAGETASVSVTDSSTTAAAATATTYTLTASATAVDEGDSGQTNLVFNLSLDKAAVSSTIVNYESLTTGTATTGVDFDSSSGSVTFAVGQQNASVTVKVKGDATHESAETVKITFTGNDLVASVTASGSITNDDPDPYTVAQAETLTIGADTLTTGSAADTFNGSTASTLDTDDTIDGGAGTDTLSATIAATESIGPTIKRVENIKLTATGALTVDARDISGVTTYTSESSTAAITINYATAVSDLTINSNTGTAAATLHTFNVTDAAIVGTADAMTISLNNIDADTVITLTDGGGTTNELETVTLNSIGLANTLTTLNTSSVETTILKVTGNKSLTVTNAIDAKIYVIDVSAHTGTATNITGTDTATIYFGGSGADTFVAGSAADIIISGAGNDIITAGAGNDIVTPGAGNDIITAGAGNDTITAGANLTSSDTVAGGTGTDTITLAAATIDTDFTNVTGVEKLTAAGPGSGATVTATGHDGVSAIAVSAAGSGYTSPPIVTFSDPSSGTTATGTATVSDYDTEAQTGGAVTAITITNPGTGYTSAPTISFSHPGGYGATATATTGVITGVTVSAGGSGYTTATLQITGNGTGATAIATIVDGKITAATVSAGGSGYTTAGIDITFPYTLGALAQAAGITKVDLATDDAYTVSASAYTVALTVDATASSGNVETLTTGSGDDIFQFATTTGLTTADIIDAGTGTDTIQLVNAAAVTAVYDADLHVGIDKIVLTDANGTATTSGEAVSITISADSATAANTLIIDGSVVTDSLDDLTVTNNAASTLTSFTITGGAGDDILAGSNTADIISSGAGNDSVASGAGTDSLTGGAGNDTFDMGTVSLTSADTVAGGDGTDKIVHGAVVDVDFTNVTGVETLQMAATGSNTLGALALAAGITKVDLATDAAYTVSASTYTVALTIDATASANNVETLTTGSGDDIFQFATTTGLTTADIIDAGTGTDTIQLVNAAAVTAVYDADLHVGIDKIVLTDANGTATTSGEAVSITISADSATAANTLIIDGSVVTDSLDDLTVTNNAASTLTSFTITGGAGDDILAGSNAADTITGGTGTNSLTGNSGNDIITGGAGIDTISDGAGNDIVDAAAGNDIITLGAGTDSITAGSGNDAITAGTNLTSADTLAGGTGTDTLTINAATVDADFTNVTAVEKLTMNDTGTYTLGALAQAAGITTVTAGVNNTAYTLAASAYTVALTVDLALQNTTGVVDTITTGSGDDIVVVDSTTGLEDGDIFTLGTGTDTIQLNNSAAAVTVEYDADDHSGVESITVKDVNGAATTSGEAVTITISADSATAANTLIIDGSNITDSLDDLTVTNNAASTLTSYTISGGAGDDILAGSNAADTITGGTGTNSLTGNSGNDIITGGAGVDTISDGAGNDIVDAAAGNDIITIGAGNDNIDAGAGTDAMSAGANLTSSDTVAGGAGTDTITLNAATIDLDFTNVTGVEAITIGSVGTQTLGALAQAAGVVTVTTIDGANTVAASAYTVGLTINAKASASDTDTFTTGSGADVFTFDGADGLGAADTISAGTGSDSIKLDNSAAAVTATVDLDNITAVETIVTATDADGASASAQAMSLTMSGVTETTVQNITIDGSAVTDADDDLTFDGSAVTVATTSFTVTGGAGDDILTGGSGADTINGGSGADTIIGGAGTDTIDAGAGNDIISSTGALLTGLDTIAGGLGTDVLSISDASTVIDDDFANVTGIETVTKAGAHALTITLGTAAAAAGVVTLNGSTAVDTITLGSGFTNNITITANGGADIYTFSSYTGTATVATGTGAHGITLGTGTEKITGNSGVETVQVAATAHLASSDVLVGAAGTDVINFSAAQTITDAQFTNVTTFETITSGNVILNLTLGAEAKEAGIVTVTLGNAANIVNASAYTSTVLTITGGTGGDSIRGGTGADILSGGNGADTYVFNATGALNGTDVITMVVADDKLDFSNMGTFTFQNTTEVAYNGTADVNITNKIILLVDVDGAASTDQIAEIVADLEGAGTAINLQSGGKAIIISGNDIDAGDGAVIFLVDDSVGTNAGTIEADDVTIIGTLATFDLDTLTAANFV